MSRSGKTFAQVRADIIADIDAVRMGRMPRETAAVIFSGVKEMSNTMNTEVAIFKTAIRAKELGLEFAQVARLGRRVVNEEEESDKEGQ